MTIKTPANTRTEDFEDGGFFDPNKRAENERYAEERRNAVLAPKNSKEAEIRLIEEELRDPEKRERFLQYTALSEEEREAIIRNRARSAEDMQKYDQLIIGKKIWTAVRNKFRDSKGVKMVLTNIQEISGEESEDEKNVNVCIQFRNGEIPVNSSRYIFGRVIGQGAWGTVYEIEDRENGEKLAAKVITLSDVAKQQMEERGLTLRDVVMKEVKRTTPVNRLVQRRLEIDDDGQYFIVMPLYTKGSLDKWIESFGRDWANPQIAAERMNERIPGLIKDIAEGVSEFHRTYHDAHCDLKLDNILIDENERADINDFGTATCTSLGMQSDSPRDNMGCVFTRAPECFEEGSHPTKRSDIYSESAVIKKLYTGKYPLEDLIKEAGSLKALIEKLGEKEVQILLKKEMKDPRIPSKVQNLLIEGTDLNPDRRPYDGADFKSRLEKALQKSDFADSMKKFTRKFTLPVLGVAAMLIGAGYKYSTYEPQELKMPVPTIQGPLYLPSDPKEERIEFDREGDPGEDTPIGGLINFDQAAKNSSDNRIVAYLGKCYAQAGMVCKNVDETSYQHEVLGAWYRNQGGGIPSHRVSPAWTTIATSITQALTESKTKDGKVDLEDMCALTRLGPSKIIEAKNIAGSVNWKDYQFAKGADGKDLIDERERKFINTWISYVYRNF